MTEIQFEKAVAAIMDVTPRAEITLDEMPAPQKLAPFAYAISAEVSNGEYDLGSGRFVLLHQPGGQETWDGEQGASARTEKNGCTFEQGNIEGII